MCKSPKPSVLIPAEVPLSTPKISYLMEKIHARLVEERTRGPESAEIEENSRSKITTVAGQQPYPTLIEKIHDPPVDEVTETKCSEPEPPRVECSEPEPPRVEKEPTKRPPVKKRCPPITIPQDENTAPTDAFELGKKEDPIVARAVAFSKAPVAKKDQIVAPTVAKKAQIVAPTVAKKDQIIAPMVSQQEKKSFLDKILLCSRTRIRGNSDETLGKRMRLAELRDTRCRKKLAVVDTRDEQLRKCYLLTPSDSAPHSSRKNRRRRLPTNILPPLSPS